MPASEEFWRSLPRMHQVFAGSAIILLGATLLMMYKDESRSWKQIQVEAEKFRLQRIEEERQRFNDAEYQAAVESLQGQADALRAEWRNRSDEIRALEAEMKKLLGRVELLKASSKTKNAERDKARADYDIAVRDQVPSAELAQALKKFELAEQAAIEEAAEFAAAERRYDELKAEIDASRSRLDETLAELDDLRAEEKALSEQKQLIAPDDNLVAVKRWVKQLPIISGFDPIHKIRYDWPVRDDVHLEQELGMVTVDRVDRCRTCHVNIDTFSVIRENGKVVGLEPGYPDEGYPQPFVSHPNPDLFLAATSPHPVNEFGCTECHQGDGSGTSFQNAEHTPADPAVAQTWAELYGWHSNHFWEAPMHPEQFIESSCLKCHHDVVELGENPVFGATAPKVFQGWETIRDYGCFGCHEINGYDGASPIGPDLRLEPNSPEELAAIEADPNAVPGKMRKVGPSLRHIASKSTPEFIAYWTEEPKRFRPSTRMPQFFDLTNQHDAMAELLQPMELAGIAKYLEAKSEEIELLQPEDGYVPDADRGRDLFAKRGCLACHGKQGEEYAGIDATFGPDLSRVHEKIKPGVDGFAWMYTWIKEPTRYHTRTKMPDLYLDPYVADDGQTKIDPAADIAAFLLAGGPAEFPQLPAPAPYLGLVTGQLTDEIAAALGLTGDAVRGVYLEEIIQGSPVDRAEIQIDDEWQPLPLLKGDVLIAISGEAVKSPEHVEEIVQSFSPGEEVSLTFVREGRENKVRVTVSTPLDDLVRLYLGKTLSGPSLEQALRSRHYPVTPEMYAEGAELSDFIKGDEIELVPQTFGEEVSPEEWEKRKLQYIGRRTISRYGCYGCHDIPGFETARPIGTALQDWGRKDTSKLAYEHIHEYLHHHGEIHDDQESDDHGGEDHGHDEQSHDDHGHAHGDAHAALGSSTAERMEKVVSDKLAGGDVSEQDLFEAAMYKSVISHGRAGFLWQKLRQPRSYDYRKTETKGWDERLRMPKFPFDSEQIEAVSTFVLGLVAQPPPPAYQYTPNKEKEAIFEGERLLAKYNCAGCHVLEMDSLVFEADPAVLDIKAQEIPEANRAAFDLLAHIKPIGRGGQGFTGEETEDGNRVYRATGFIQGKPDPEEEDPDFRFYSYRFWDGFQLDDGKYILPAEAVQIGEGQIREFVEGRGGNFGEWLVDRLAPELSKTPGGTDYNAAWQASVPPLTFEGHKVQTPWLYQFLKNPEPLRRTTVLRMPKFNMDDDEAQALANYFAAIDGVAFPYQNIPQKEQSYQSFQAAEYQQEYPEAEHDFLEASWLVLNGPLCRKCHNVGGNVVNDPKQVKGPHLQRIEQRLRPEWTQLWVYKPMWVYPYTAMPENFPADKPADMKELFGGHNPRQAEAVIDALFNYTHLIDEYGQTTYDPPGATPPAGAEAAGAEE